MPTDRSPDRGGGTLLGGSRAGEEGFGERGEGPGVLPLLTGLGVNAGYKIADGSDGERARLGETNIGVAAQGDADRLRSPWHPAHDEERDHAPVGDADT